MWQLLILGAVGFGAYFLLRNQNKEGSSEEPPMPPDPEGEVVNMSFEEAKAAYGDQPQKQVYLVAYEITGAFPSQQTWAFMSDGHAENAYQMLLQFFSDPTIRQAYTWPMGEVRVMKWGTPPAASRFALIDKSGVSVG